MNTKMILGTAVAAILLLALASCGGGGGGGGVKGAQNANANSGAGTKVTVTVADPFGAPAQATVFVTSGCPAGCVTFRGLTDKLGKVTFSNLTPGVVYTNAEALSPESIRLVGSAGEMQLTAKAQIALTINLKPEGTPSIGLVKASVDLDGIKDDGRVLEFSLSHIPVTYDDQSLTWVYFTLDHCLPDAGNDAPNHTADCIEGSVGFDAEYTAANAGEPLSVESMPGGTPAPFSAAVLIDQSRSMVVNDPWDARLFGARYFLVSKDPTGRVALAAFATDDQAAGELSSLPERPVTIYPTGNPGFVTSPSALVTAVEGLKDLEGGATPLYQAVDRMLDFTAANAPAGERRAVVVVTDGRDDTCGSTSACLSARKAVIDKSRATGIEIITVGLLSPTGDHRALYDLAETHGVAFWVEDPSQLGAAVGALGQLLDGTTQTHTARFRLESPDTGAFESGRTVLGKLNIKICPWDCYGMTLPIEIRLP